MSLILSEESVEVVRSRKKKVLGCKCDICDKELIPEERKPKRYFTVITGHNDWGYESVESRELYDICPDCIDKFVSEYLIECSDTGYLEVQTEQVYFGQTEYDD